MKRSRSILMTLGTLLALSYIILFPCCKSVSNVTKTTSNEKIEIVYKDSINYKDSIVIIPIEKVVNIVNKYDTLELETSQARAKAWVDSIFLRGEISNKDIVKYKYIEKSKVDTRDSIFYKEKLVYKEKTITVKNPLNWKILVWAIIATLGLLGTLWLTFRKKIIKYIF